MKIEMLAAPTLAALLLAAPAWSEAELEELGTPTTEAAEAAGETAEPEAPPVAASTGSVVRATFTTDVLEREPQNEITTLENDHPLVFYFTELRGMTGRTVTHRWEFAGEVKAETSYAVGGPRWRVFSSKNLDPTWLGEWTVTVVDDTGRELRSDRFTYT